MKRAEWIYCPVCNNKKKNVILIMYRLRGFLDFRIIMISYCKEGKQNLKDYVKLLIIPINPVWETSFSHGMIQNRQEKMKANWLLFLMTKTALQEVLKMLSFIMKQKSFGGVSETKKVISLCFLRHS